VTTLQVPPAAPSALSATVPSSTQINLTWQDNSNNEQGFKIERWNGSSFAEINSVGINAYSDTGLSPATTYLYRVRAYNTEGSSGPSNELSVTTLSCAYSISPLNATVATAGGTVNVNVTTGAGCQWTTGNNNFGWLSVSPINGVGSGVAHILVDFNNSNVRRQGSVTIAGKTFPIQQDWR
jgi:hypothetical protein